MTIQQTILPTVLNELDIETILEKINGNSFLIKQGGKTGFRKYFSTKHQLTKIQNGYYDDDEKVFKPTEYTEDEGYELDSLVEELGL